MKIRNRLALATSLIVAITLTVASSLIFWSVWKDEQEGNYEATTKSLLIGLTLLVFIGTTSSYFLGRYLSKKALDPVQEFIFQVEQATESTRISVTNTNDDIGKIANSLNGLLARLQASSLNQRRFTADAAHELRGPLTTIQLSIDALRASEDSTELKDVSKEIGRLAKLCNDLLDLSRADGQMIEKSEHQLIEIVQEQLTTFGRINSSVEVVIDDTVNQSILCNSQLFGLAIRNLLENAFHYARSQINVSARQEPEGIHVIIKDDGPGVPVEENENIFERFYRSEKVRTNGKGGTGLGLSVVTAVMQAHGGKAMSIQGSSGGEFHLLLMS